MPRKAALYYSWPGLREAQRPALYGLCLRASEKNITGLCTRFLLSLTHHGPLFSRENSSLALTTLWPVRWEDSFDWDLASYSIKPSMPSSPLLSLPLLSLLRGRAHPTLAFLSDKFKRCEVRKIVRQTRVLKGFLGGDRRRPQQPNVSTQKEKKGFLWLHLNEGGLGYAGSPILYMSGSRTRTYTQTHTYMSMYIPVCPHLNTTSFLQSDVVMENYNHVFLPCTDCQGFRQGRYKHVSEAFTPINWQLP